MLINGICLLITKAKGSKIALAYSLQYIGFTIYYLNFTFREMKEKL